MKLEDTSFETCFNDKYLTRFDDKSWQAKNNTSMQNPLFILRRKSQPNILHDEPQLGLADSKREKRFQSICDETLIQTINALKMRKTKKDGLEIIKKIRNIVEKNIAP